MPVRSWIHLCASDFQSMEREKTLVLLPFGSTEQHGPHLPVGTDTLLVEEVLRRVAPRLQELDALVLPALWCTKSNEHIGFTSSLYLQAETMMAVVHDLAATISRSGFKRLVFMNWHGGNTDLLAAMGRDIRQRHNLFVFIIDIVHSFLNLSRDANQPQVDYDIHAGQYETSLMLAAYPDLVRTVTDQDIGSDFNRGKIARSFQGYQFLLPEGGPVYIAWETRDLSSDGVIGNPAKIDLDKGKRDFDFMVSRVEAILREISTFQFQE